MGVHNADSRLSEYVRDRLDEVVGRLGVRDPVHPDPAGGAKPPSRSGATPVERLGDRSPEGDPVRGEAAVLRFTARHLTIVAVVLALGAVIAGYALTRAQTIPVSAPAAIEPQAPPPSPSAPSAASTLPASAASGQTVGPVLRVHVLGDVRRPGVVSLPAGARVVDALEAAGGMTDKARPGELNLAQVLADGQQILVGGSARAGGEVRGTAAVGESGAAGPTDASAAAAPGAGGKININTATTAQLDTLPGVGPVTAQKIIAWRTEHQRFSRVEELQEVPGIGPKSYAEIAPHVTL